MADLKSLAKYRLTQMDDENALNLITHLRFLRRTNTAPLKTKAKKSEVLVKGASKAARKPKAETVQKKIFQQAASLSPEQIAQFLNRGKELSNGRG